MTSHTPRTPYGQLQPCDYAAIDKLMETIPPISPQMRELLARLVIPTTTPTTTPPSSREDGA